MALIDQIENDTLLLTRDGRLARALRLRLITEQAQNGRRAWRTPLIQSARQALVREWESSWPIASLLHPAQSKAMMQQIIDTSPEAESLLSTGSMARLAMEAEHLRRHYHLSLDAPEFKAFAESAAFASWSKRFTKAKSEINAIDFDDLYQILKVHRPRANKILLAGFDRLTPLQNALFESWKTMGVQIIHADISRRSNKNISARIYPTFSDEIHELAAELREMLERHHGVAENMPSVAVVVPNYERLMPVLDSVLRRYLAPHTLYVEQNEVASLPYHFTRGTALNHHELIAVALLILGLRQYHNVIDKISALLLTRRIAGYAYEQDGRARADIYLREHNGRRMPFRSIVHATKKFAPGLHRRLCSMQRVLSRYNDTASSLVWARRFRRRLQLMGWPGDMQMNENTAVAYRRFNEELERFASLDGMLPAMSFDKALESFVEVISEQLFLPQQNYRAPIEIMPLENLAGHHYDVAMAVCLNTDNLPKHQNTNPLIPAELQRRTGMPAADPQVALEQARKIAENLKYVAQDVSISCHEMTEEGAPLLPCSLFDGWIRSAQKNMESVTSSVALEASNENPIPIQHDEKSPILIKHGIRVLADYARSPFFAFAIHRLKTVPFPEPVEGWTADLQGTLLHDVMKFFWREVENSTNLERLSDTEKTHLLGECFDRAAKDCHILESGRISTTLLSLERIRQIHIIVRWLKYESTRPEPFEVVATEQTGTIEIEGLEFRVRMDRLDRIKSDDQDYYLLWDYKTGQNSATEKGWKPESLLEPQLPAYAALADFGGIKIDGIAIAQIADGRIKTAFQSGFIKALTDSDKPKSLANWNQCIEDWQKSLALSARGYVEGRAELLPRALQDNEFTHGFLKKII
ncbi:PD-(D/E)XK nuclease family protein [Acidihalobacter prosperus]